MPQFDIVPGLTFVTRDICGANLSLPRLGERVPRNLRTHVFVHHTVIVDGDKTPNIWETENEIFAQMRKLQTVRPDLGNDVPYNFVVFLTTINNGLYICEGRGEDRAGAHTKGHNTRSIATSFAGDFQNQQLDPMEIALRIPLYSKFLGWLQKSASHSSYGEFTPLSKLGTLKPSGRSVFFHRDVKATDCPGEKLEVHLRTARFDWP